MLTKDKARAGLGGRFLTWLCGKFVVKISEIRDPIATRKLLSGTDDVIVIIGRPEVHPEGDFFCPYAIQCKSDQKTGYACGSDSVQALILALERIGIDLKYLETPSGEPVSWFADTPGDTGFPD